MKKIALIIVLFLFSKNLFSQTYTFGALSSSGVTVKSIGKIIIDDKNVTISSEGKIFKYDFIKNANNIIYFTDGVMTHYFTLINENGKKKGFDYDCMINYQMDKNVGGTNVVYWCKKE